MGCGKGITTLEAKLLHHMMAMRESVLHTIFLDLNKSYAALDWDRCLDILAGYGEGPQMLRLLHTYWT